MGQRPKPPSQPASQEAKAIASAHAPGAREPPPLPFGNPSRTFVLLPFIPFLFLDLFPLCFLILVYFLPPTPSNLSPLLYKYPNTPPLNPSNQAPSPPPHHTPRPTLPPRHPTPAPPHLAHAAAAALRHAAGAPRRRPRRRLPRVSFPRIVFF